MPIAAVLMNRIRTASWWRRIQCCWVAHSRSTRCWIEFGPWRPRAKVFLEYVGELSYTCIIVKISWK
jgi:hypothetical protein